MGRIYSVDLEWAGSSGDLPEKGEEVEDYLRRNFSRIDPKKYCFLVWNPKRPALREVKLTDKIGEDDLIIVFPRPDLLAIGITNPEEIG